MCSAKATEAVSSNNGAEHSAVKVLLCQQLGLFGLSYSGKVDSVAAPVKLGASRAAQPGQRHISFIFGEELDKLGKHTSPTQSRSASCAHIYRLHLL